MPRSPPRRVEKRSSASRADYYREGRRHLERAVALYPECCELEALALAQEHPADPDVLLRPSSVRRYLEDHRVVVAVLVRSRRVQEIDAFMARIEAALASRKASRGRPAPRRGAGLRVTDATDAEARVVFGHMKAIALRHRAMTAAAAALYVLVESRIGVRPVELCGALVEGRTLLIPNAKLADGQARWRAHDLGQVPDCIVEAVRHLVLLAPAPGHPRAFVLWRNGIASCLARACEAVRIRRLSLYSFRHVAIATWEASGFSAAEIARLAGHMSLATARAHYARARSGWAIEGLPQPVEPPTAAAETEVERNEVSPTERSEAFPETPPVSEPSSPPAGQSPIAIWQANLVARIGPATLSLRPRPEPAEDNDPGPAEPSMMP